MIMKKSLKVTETEKEVALFLDNLLKPKVPVPKISTREVKEKKNRKCETCNFGGRTQQDLERHIDQEHGENAVQYCFKCKFDCGFTHEDQEALCYHHWTKHSHLEP